MKGILQDTAFRTLPLWLIITMLNTSVLLGALIFSHAIGPGDLRLPTNQLLVVFWLPIAIYLLAGKTRVRCYRIDMTLPIAATTLWKRHLSAVIVATSTVLAGSVGVLLFHSHLVFESVRGMALEVSLLPLVGPLMAGLSLAAVLMDAVEPGLWRLRGRPRYWALGVGSLLSILTLLIALSRWPWLSVGICLALALAVLGRTRRALPAAYRLVPAQAAPAHAEPAATTTISASTSKWQLYRILFGVLHTIPPWKQSGPYALYLMIGLMGFFMSGGFNRWFDTRYLQFLYISFASYVLFMGIGILTYNLNRLDPLPVSRRTLLAFILLPSLIVFCGGYAIGWLAITTDPDPKPSVEYQVDTPGIWVEVDDRFMGVSFKGEAPNLDAPWGESHEAWRRTLLRDGSTLIYNPYNTVEETTADFEALMTSRAIKEIYETRIPPEEIRDRYFVVEDDRVVDLAKGGFTLLEDYPALRQPPTGPKAPVYMVLIMVPWLLLVSLFLGSFRATATKKNRTRRYMVGLLLLIGPMVAQALLAVFRVFDPEVGRTLLDVAILRLGIGPASWFVTWLVSLGVILACIWLAQSRFEEAEIPASPVDCSMIDWQMQD